MTSSLDHTPDLSTPRSRPDTLTIDMVVSTYAHELKAAIRKFSAESPDDAYNAIILHLITPWESTGLTPLDGYALEKGSPGAYLFQASMNVLLKRDIKRRRRDHLAPEVRIVSSTPANVSCGADFDSTEGVSEEQLESAALLDPDAYALSMSDIARALENTAHAKVLRISEAGEPVSTQRMLEMFIFEDRSLTDIAKLMGVGQSDVRRRFSRLKNESWVHAVRMSHQEV